MRGFRHHCLIVTAVLALMGAAAARAEDATELSVPDAEMLFPLAVQTMPDGTKQLDVAALPVPLGLAIIDLSRRVDSLEAEIQALKQKAE